MRAYQGAGLGLSISKAYVEMLGGKLWVESKKRKGSIFYFTIPNLMVLQKTNEIGKENSQVTIDKQAIDLRILIIEDDKTSDLFLSIKLRDISKETLHAKNGFEVIELYRKNPDIDLVLMDIRMPLMNGFEATRQLRQLNENLIIIAQSARALDGDGEKAIAAGCNAFVSKPLIIDELMSLIQRYFVT
ncbi:MAG: CheY-like chemotaxis protein [Cyclobacteriaceae bacterium]|jgi:CheY-like chemotaxis protein